MHACLRPQAAASAARPSPSSKWTHAVALTSPWANAEAVDACCARSRPASADPLNCPEADATGGLLESDTQKRTGVFAKLLEDLFVLKHLPGAVLPAVKDRAR